MLRDISGNTFVNLSSGGVDSDATSFITAASITDSIQITAIQNLVRGLKRHALWDKMVAIYPFVGGTQASHSYNLKDPRDLNAAYRLVFSGGGWTHSSGGIQGNGTSSYANTFFNPSTNGVLNNAHISIYSRTDSAPAGLTIDIGNNQQIGSQDAGSSIGIRSSNVTYFNIHTPSSTSPNTSTSLGFYVANRTLSTTTRNTANGQIIIISSDTLYAGNSNIYIGAMNNPSLGSVGVYFSSRQFAFASIGSGLTFGEQVQQFYNVVQEYQTTLGRQVLTPVIPRASIPSVIYTPQQIFGTGLTLWYDFSDKSVLFINTTATINVQNDNDPIMYVRNKGIGEPSLNQDLTTYATNTVSPPINSSAVTFTNNALNSNKGIGRYGLVAGGGYLRMINGINFSSSTGVITSALTFSIVFKKQPTLASSEYLFNMSTEGCVSPLVFQWFNGSSNANFSVRVYNNATPPAVGHGVSIPSSSFDNNNFNIFTATVDENSVIRYYVNNTFVSSATSSVGNIHPITYTRGINLSRGAIYWELGCSNQYTTTANGNSSVAEIILSKGTVLNDDQVYKLHRYFKSKYNI